MRLIDSLLDELADRLDRRIQGRVVSQSFRDIEQKGSVYEALEDTAYSPDAYPQHWELAQE